MPGVSAFPNYYFSRGEYKIVEAKQINSNMDGSEVSSNRFFKKNSRHFVSVCLIIFASCSDQEPVGSPDAQVTTEQTVYEWKMITSWPKNLPGPGVTAQLLADTINELSGGRTPSGGLTRQDQE